LQEILRSRHEERWRVLKRLAFVVYAAPVDFYLDHLPHIQERIVDALRIRDNLPLLVQVFLCLRVLLLRFSPKSLSPFWPVILTELMKIFTMSNPESELLLAATKFLHLAFIIPNEEFNLFKWMFANESSCSLAGGTSVPSAIGPLQLRPERAGENTSPPSTAPAAVAPNSATPRQPAFLPYMDRLSLSLLSSSAPPSLSSSGSSSSSSSDAVRSNTLPRFLSLETKSSLCVWSQPHASQQAAAPSLSRVTLLDFITHFSQSAYSFLINAKEVDKETIQHLILSDFIEES